MDELTFVHTALWTLYMNDPVWESNYRIFMRMDDSKRYIWWERMKRQAEKGAPTARVLLLKIIELRMKS